jgi:hypothetical protein
MQRQRPGDTPGRAGARWDHVRQMSAGRVLWLVSLAAVLANASWFSATAVVPALQRQWGLTSAGAAWLVIVVQVGFVVGSVGAALLNLPDRLEPRRLIAAAARRLVRRWDGLAPNRKSRSHAGIATCCCSAGQPQNA